jgi:enolase-phosphatase E1
VTGRLRERGVTLVLLDIEGTTTPMAFVYDVLFPYARARLGTYLRAHASEDQLRDLLATVRVEWQEDARRGEQPPDWAHADIPAAARYFEWLMDRDRKSPSLKRIQGEIWEAGFRSGELRGEIFPDVAPAFARWKAGGIDIAIYSSGSTLAQRLIFGATSAGDLTPLISGFFDTGVGPKRSVDSYRRIATEMGRAPQEMLFVSDVPDELNAALDAGCQILLAVRPGNRAVDGPESLDEVSSFDELLA